ncbi:uncharacterized protein EAE98_002646 [Botrytis deweyae]|uniref:Uncharacterized protein n=1 Tax=Botrytis deweyae TaxID=2478750 RepID=A0ABQ7IXR4_9HELO|nr:uncharacterized protein EAE98_002646 [Botrytis deweyae]KAF7936427.1 hypothetical protein EAE98_002646 [Botrytis deweyae]
MPVVSRGTRASSQVSFKAQADGDKCEQVCSVPEKRKIPWSQIDLQMLVLVISDVNAVRTSEAMNLSARVMIGD